MSLLQQPLQIDVSGISGGGAGGAIVGQSTVQGVAATPGWQVVADLYWTKPPSGWALEAIMVMSTASLQGRVRIWDTVLNAQMPGALLTFAAPTIVDTRAVTADLAPVVVINRIYQLQIECTGGVASTDLGILREASGVKP